MIECTGVSANWCPNCGDCCCANPQHSKADILCPLHAPDSEHAREVQPDIVVGGSVATFDDFTDTPVYGINWGKLTVVTLEGHILVEDAGGELRQVHVRGPQ